MPLKRRRSSKLISDSVEKSEPFNLDVICGLPVTMKGPSYTLIELLTNMAKENLKIRLFAPSVSFKPENLPFEIVTISTIKSEKLHLLAHKFCGRLFKSLNEKAALKAILSKKHPHAVYTFGEISLKFSKHIKESGIFLVREKFACGKHVSREILTKLYHEMQINQETNISVEAVEKEKLELQLADAVFSPSPMVKRSLIDIGIDEDVIIESSYGWNPERLSQDEVALVPHDGITLLFVGYITFSKGAHILLEAWVKAGICGRIVFAGRMDPVFKERYKSLFSRPDILVLSYTKNIGPVYRSADWFVFPSFTEGGPQVTYEAMALGVPCITSEMGAGAVLRDDDGGIIVDHSSIDKWAELIASLPNREHDRNRYSEEAKLRATDFTWDHVGKLRAQMLTKAVEQKRSIALTRVDKYFSES